MDPLLSFFGGLSFQQERALLGDDLELSCAVWISDDQNPIQALSLVDRSAAQVKDMRDRLAFLAILQKGADLSVLVALLQVEQVLLLVHLEELALLEEETLLHDELRIHTHGVCTPSLPCKTGTTHRSEVIFVNDCLLGALVGGCQRTPIDFRSHRAFQVTTTRCRAVKLSLRVFHIKDLIFDD